MTDATEPHAIAELLALRAARRDILGFLGRFDHLATPERADWLAGVNAAVERRILRLIALNSVRDLPLDR